MAVSSSTIVLSGLTATAFVVAGLAFTAYNIMEWRNNVTRKVDALRPFRAGAAEVRKVAARPVRLGVPAYRRGTSARSCGAWRASVYRPSGRSLAYTMFRVAVGLACLVAMSIIASRVGAQFFAFGCWVSPSWVSESASSSPLTSSRRL